MRTTPFHQLFISVSCKFIGKLKERTTVHSLQLWLITASIDSNCYMLSRSLYIISVFNHLKISFRNLFTFFKNAGYNQDHVLNFMFTQNLKICIIFIFCMIHMKLIYNPGIFFLSKHPWIYCEDKDLQLLFLVQKPLPFFFVTFYYSNM